MKFGSFYELQLPRPWAEQSEHTLIKRALEQVELSDRCGFDYIWATEHHFLEEYAHSSAPEVFLAACSQRTRYARIGHGIVQMSPLINHPARVAERIATLDLISDGRCEFGAGAGATETELGGFLVPQDEKKAMMLEGFGVAIRMLVEDPFRGVQGKYVKVPPRNVVPKPLQKPHPPLWMACSSRASILQAARLGVGALAFSFVSPEEARLWARDYHQIVEEESQPIGYQVNPQLAIACPFLCDRDETRVQEMAAENHGFFVYGIGHYSFFGSHEPGRTDLWREFHTHPHEFLPPEGRVQDCVGTPETIRTRLREFEDAGIDQVICLSQAGNVPHDMLCSSIELFAREVLPEFKERDLSCAGQQAERRSRVNDKAMGRKPQLEIEEPRTVIVAAGHH